MKANHFTIAVSLAACILAASCQFTADTPGAGSVSSLEYIVLGGARQLTLIRGNDVSKPILLFVHGGPGVPGIPMEHIVRDWEDDFIVVFYDQRGTGRSWPLTVEENVTLGQYVSDAKQLIDILLRRFGKEKLYLMGHSWGSIIGARVAAESPGKLYAYIGMGQMADGMRNETEAYDYTVNAARARGDSAALSALSAIKPPYVDANGRQIPADLKTARTWLDKMGGVFCDSARWNNDSVLKMFLECTEYNLFDFLLLDLETRGRETCRVIWNDQLAVNFFTQIPRLDVPFYVFMGKYDHNVSYAQAREYFDAVVVPPGKKFVTFERSGHYPLLEEPAACREALRVMVAETGGW